MSIDSIVEKLANCQVTENTFNQYSYEHPLGKVTRTNISIYLKRMKKEKCNTILIGEAAGYKGCRLSGIPFTSEYILKHGLYKNLFGDINGYTVYKDDQINKEISATIVWQTLEEYNKLPLMWNAYPFHPHKTNDIYSNRAPYRNELELGKVFLEDIINEFSIDNIIAVGNKAKSSLDTMGMNCIQIRHPANGGKGDFRKGILNYCI
jgi:hypothetical protein